MNKKESMLKKQFQKKDVQRLRNIITEKHSDKTTQGIGYTKKKEFYNEGDIWKEDGRTWTIKEGIKQNITKLDKAKKYGMVPIFCPSCKKPMNYHQDKKFYFLYKRCFNCQVGFEADIKKQGLWDEYEKNIINSDIDGLIKDFTQFIEEEVNRDNQGFITEAGDVEKWVGKLNKKQILQNKKQTISYLKSLKKD